MKIGIELRETAYLPEALAYKNYLENKGHVVQLDYSNNFCKDNHINILFAGFIPFWKKINSSSKIIHEYSSLSTGSFPRTKDFIKRALNKKPDGRIFPSPIIMKKLKFKNQDDTPYIFRDFGVESELFRRTERDKQYDIVYCGSIAGRRGLIKQINNLSDLGFSLIIVGKLNQKDKNKLTKNRNITLTGVLERGSIKNIYAESRFGLNYTPDTYPFNIQTSIKTLEYLASGLPVISNKYKWIIDFSRQNNGAKIIWLDKVNYPLEDFPSSYLSRDYSWEYILEKSRFEDFLKYIASEDDTENIEI